MSEQTEVSFDAALMMALRADAQKELDELPTPAQLKERYPDTSRWDARLQAALHKRRPVLKRVLVAALTLVILTLGALAVSADFRKAVYTMIQKFLPIEMQLTYQVDGEPLEQLPNGYSDHYVPDGFERDREQEFERAENFLHVYSSKESGEGYTVRCSIIQPGQQSSFDNEHTTYKNVKVGDGHKPKWGCCWNSCYYQSPEHIYLWKTYKWNRWRGYSIEFFKYGNNSDFRCICTFNCKRNVFR